MSERSNKRERKKRSEAYKEIVCTHKNFISNHNILIRLVDEGKKSATANFKSRPQPSKSSRVLVCGSNIFMHTHTHTRSAFLLETDKTHMYKLNKACERGLLSVAQKNQLANSSKFPTKRVINKMDWTSLTSICSNIRPLRLMQTFADSEELFCFKQNNFQESARVSFNLRSSCNMNVIALMFYWKFRYNCLPIALQFLIELDDMS